jgi:hypothetical protein
MPLPKRDEVRGKSRKLNNEELHKLYSSPNIIRQIKSRRMRWAEHVALMGEKSFQWESSKERDLPEEQVVDGTMGPERILGRLAGGSGLDSVAQDRGR